MAAVEFTVMRNYAITFSVELPRSRRWALLRKLLPPPQGPLETLTVVSVDCEKVTIQTLLKGIPSVEEQVKAIENALVELGFPGIESWGP